MIPNKDRVPLGNGKSRMLRAPADIPKEWGAYREQLIAGEAYVDILANDQTTGANAGIVRKGTLKNKAKFDELLAASGTTAGTATALTLDQEGFNLRDGAVVRIKLHTDLQGGATLNVAGTGAKPLLTVTGDHAEGFPAGTWLEAVYSAATGAYMIPGGGSGAETGFNINLLEEVGNVKYLKELKPNSSLINLKIPTWGIGDRGGYTVRVLSDGTIVVPSFNKGNSTTMHCRIIKPSGEIVDYSCDSTYNGNQPGNGPSGSSGYTVYCTPCINDESKIIIAIKLSALFFYGLNLETGTFKSLYYTESSNYVDTTAGASTHAAKNAFAYRLNGYGIGIFGMANGSTTTGSRTYPFFNEDLSSYLGSKSLSFLSDAGIYACMPGLNGTFWIGRQYTNNPDLTMEQYSISDMGTRIQTAASTRPGALTWSYIANSGISAEDGKFTFVYTSSWYSRAEYNMDGVFSYTTLPTQPNISVRPEFFFHNRYVGVYDGNSAILNSEGKTLAEAPFYKNEAGKTIDFLPLGIYACYKADDAAGTIQLWWADIAAMAETLRSPASPETGTWTCPETGTYKIIAVGGGAAGTASYGGGSGELALGTLALQKGDVVQYQIGQGGRNGTAFGSFQCNSSSSIFGDLTAPGANGNSGGFDGGVGASAGGAGGYDLQTYGGRGMHYMADPSSSSAATYVRQGLMAPDRNGGTSANAGAVTSGAGYGAGGGANQDGKDGVIVIMR